MCEIFAYVTGFFFFNPTIEVVTFRLRGLCMLGVFLLPAFTRLGHECQDLFDCYVHRLDLGLYSHSKEFWGNGVRTHVNSKGIIHSTGKKSPQRRIEPTTLHQLYRKILLRGGSNTRRCIKQESDPNTLPTSYSGSRKETPEQHFRERHM